MQMLPRHFGDRHWGKTHLGSYLRALNCSVADDDTELQLRDAHQDARTRARTR